MNILISVSAIQAARKLLTRIRFERLKLPVLTHVLATVDAAGLTLAVTDLDHWLETRLSATINPTQPPIQTKPIKPENLSARFLIPAAALAAAARGDKNGTVHFAYLDNPDADHPVLRLTVTCGGMPVESVHKPEPVSGFPERPVIQGRITTVPKETFQALRTVAGCASTDATRYVLNGVLFSPDHGGTLVATDGRCLAGAPARFVGREFILPNAAVHVLGFPDFTGRDAAMLQAEAADGPHVQFRSGPHTLIARTIEENYPNYRCVMPGEFLSDATIHETHRPALISWLRSLDGRSPTVRLTWQHPGQLTLIHWDYDTPKSTIQVPVTTSGAGRPPTIAFSPKYLADALIIGSTLRFVDGMSPALATDPACGNYCLIMPCRFTEAAADDVETKTKAAAPAGVKAPAPAIAA